jgi:hypothetical protein
LGLPGLDSSRATAKRWKPFLPDCPKIAAGDLVLQTLLKICDLEADWREHMATKDKLRNAAVTIGTAMGKAEGKAHRALTKAAKAAHVARLELVHLSKQVDELKKQLNKSTKRLKKALK